MPYDQALEISLFFKQTDAMNTLGGEGSGDSGQVQKPVEWHELVPRLQRFYGAADPLVWLRMPHGVLADFAAQMSAIAAQESLRRVSEVAVGSGSLKRADARRTLRQWHREANRGQGRINHKPEPGRSTMLSQRPRA